MPLPVIANVLRVAVEGVLPNGHQFANVMHIRKTGALSYTGAIAVADPLILALYATDLAAVSSWKTNVTAGTKLTQFRYTPLDGSSATTVTPHSVVGTHAGDPLPANVAVVTTLYTALRGRNHRGRQYWVGMEEGDNLGNGQIDPVLVGRWQSQWTAYLASLGGSGVSQVVASYRYGTAEDVVSALTQSRWDTQRRRLNS